MDRSVILGAAGLLLYVAFSPRVISERAPQNEATHPSSHASHSSSLTLCSTGVSTLLKFEGTPRAPHHNGDQGKAHFILAHKESSTTLWEETLPGEGVCFGYNLRRRAHLIGIQKEHGIGVRITDLYYIDEVKAKRSPSLLKQAKLEAFVALPGPELRFIALIALEGNDTFLYALDVEKSLIRKLGKAPLPPPLTAQERDGAKAHPESEAAPWEWMASYRDSQIELDPGIMVFKNPSTLEVSYGNDSAEHRASNREVVVWDLIQGQPAKKQFSAPRRPN